VTKKEERMVGILKAIDGCWSYRIVARLLYCNDQINNEYELQHKAHHASMVVQDLDVETE
jgi:hypothetical protein